MKRLIMLFLSINITTSYASFQAEADGLINKIDSHINIGIEVTDLTTGNTLYQRNNKRPFIPASNMKLFSTAAALMILGPDYHFINQLSTTAQSLQKGVLKGSIYLKLSGDPSFNQARLAQLLAVLKKWHVQRIQGDIIIDSSNAMIAPYALGRMIEDLPYSYGAPIAPVIIDANRLVVTINPADKPGKLALIESEDRGKSLVINNQVITKTAAPRCGISFTMDKDNRLTLKGCIGLYQAAVNEKVAIRNPLKHLAGLIQAELKKNTIDLTGAIKLGSVPNGSLLLANDYSKAVAQLIADTLKPSDNIYADSLFLQSARKLQGHPVNWGEAQILIKKFLQQQTGINLTQSVLTDGSGLSRYDLLTPSQTVNLLRFLYERFPLSYEYITALPVSGRDGTLEKRFKKITQQDLIRAKTGYMKGVASLSGYLYTTNAHTLVFAIYINNVPGTSVRISSKYRYLVDSLCNYFLNQKPNTSAWARIFKTNHRIKFQQNISQAEVLRTQEVHWRNVEFSLRHALKNHAVAVVYRNNEIMIYDQHLNPQGVWKTLIPILNRYALGVSVASAVLPSEIHGYPRLWREKLVNRNKALRIWSIHPTIG